MTKTPDKKMMVRLLMLVGICVLSVIHAQYYYKPPAGGPTEWVTEDAHILFRYSENFAAGHGLVFNVGEKVEGYVCFLWAVLLGLLKKMGMSVTPVAHNMGILFAVLTVGVLYLFNRVILERDCLLAPALFGLNSGMVVWAVSGQETLMYTFLLFSALFLYLYENKTRKVFPWSALLVTLGMLSRPEGVLLLVILLVHLYRETYRRSLLPTTRFWLYVTVPVIIYFTYFVWRFRYYGWFFPNVYYTKTGGGVYQWIRGIAYTQTFFEAFGGILLLALPLVLLMSDSIRKKAWFVCTGAFSAIYTMYIIYVGGDAAAMFRFFIPLLPFLYILIQESGLLLTSAMLPVNTSYYLRVSVHYTLRGLLLLGALWPTFSPRGEHYKQFIEDKVWSLNYIQLGKYLKEHANSNALMAAKACGAVPYYSGLRTVDMLGLCDEHIAHIDVPTMGKGTSGHEKEDFDYVLSRRPDLIFMGDQARPFRRRAFRTNYGDEYEPKSIKIGKGSVVNINRGRRWASGANIGTGDIYLNVFVRKVPQKNPPQ